MAERRLFSILSEGVQLQIAVGERVSLPTNGRGVDVGIVPDPVGTHIVICCDDGRLEVEEVDEAERAPVRHP
jgi:hypothetical protein